ncbi:helix-turn-helix domain-containing protein [Dyadobacter sp. Leaf189]|uniref:helix-turn-helix domain-containing protein n=1 Tax=Dyadobacter sp. Leaf189 TaxID=1736295 RepID=UPI0006F8E150|nr:hypothetical protein ASG33_10155 [Dyadobacter sp. Leaf189]
MNRVELGRSIAARRQDLGLKQEDAAEMANLTAKTLYTIERGKGNPSLASLEKLLDVLGMTLHIAIRSTDDEGARL